MDRPCTRATLNRPITNNAMYQDNQQAGDPAKPGHAASFNNFDMTYEA